MAYHISRLKKPKKHKYSSGGLQIEHRHRKTGHSTVEGVSYLHQHKRLKTQAAPHLIHRHPHHVPTGHKHPHGTHPTSAVTHQERASGHNTNVHVSRHDAAIRAAITRREKGEVTGFSRLTPEQRSAYAKRAAITRRVHGTNPLSHLNAAQKHLRAVHASATRKSKHENNFSHESAATRHASAIKSAASRKAHGVKPFGTMSAAARSAAAKKAALSRRARHVR